MNDMPLSAKEYLSQAYRIDQRINAKLEQVERLRALTCKATVMYDGEHVSHTRNVSAMEDTIIRLMEAEKEVNQEIDALVDLKRDIRAVLRQIREPEFQLLLELRYLCFKSWSEIAIVMEYEDRYVYKVHGRALGEVEKILAARAAKDIV